MQVSAQDEFLPLVADPVLLPDETDMSLQDAEKDIVAIRETLKWHARVGWFIAGAYIAIFGGFITWYLPKELNTQKTEIIQGVQLEIGKIRCVQTFV